jgi:hypothetical protein
MVSEDDNLSDHLYIQWVWYICGVGMSTGRQLLDELRRDEELRRALAEELLPEALRHR